MERLLMAKDNINRSMLATIVAQQEENVIIQELMLSKSDLTSAANTEGFVAKKATFSAHVNDGKVSASSLSATFQEVEFTLQGKKLIVWKYNEKHFVLSNHLKVSYFV
jgi:hypothetical protein